MTKKKDPPEDRARYAKMTKEERLQSFKRTIAHPHLQAADKQLREAIQEPGGASIINVFGPARVGKTTMKNHVMRTIILEMLPLLEQDRERVPLLSLTPRPPTGSSFSWKDFFQDGLVAFDEPLIDNKIVLDTEDDEEQTDLIKQGESRMRRKPPEGTKDALRRSFETAGKRRRPIAILIDEAQHLGMVSGMRQLRIQLECIKSLAEATGAVIVLIGTYDLLPLRNLSAQLIGRSLDVHFSRYHSTQKELSQFKNVLRTFQDALPFVAETNILLDRWEFCYEQSIGCVGNLRLLLVRAVRAALWTNAKTLSWKHLRTHAFSTAECYEMMREAYEGERELASKPNQRAKLLAMLGLDSQIKSKSSVPQSETPQTEETAPVQDSQSSEITDGTEQEIAPAETLADKASSEVQPTSDNLSNEATNGAEEEKEVEETPSAEALPKSLKKPKSEPTRPFRRKNTRDRTGGPRRSNEKD